MSIINALVPGHLWRSGGISRERGSHENQSARNGLAPGSNRQKNSLVIIMFTLRPCGHPEHPWSKIVRRRPFFFPFRRLDKLPCCVSLHTSSSVLLCLLHPSLLLSLPSLALLCCVFPLLALVCRIQVLLGERPIRLSGEEGCPTLTTPVVPTSPVPVQTVPSPLQLPTPHLATLDPAP